MCCYCLNHAMYVVFMNQYVYLCQNKSIYLSIIDFSTEHNWTSIYSYFIFYFLFYEHLEDSCFNLKIQYTFYTTIHIPVLGSTAGSNFQECKTPRAHNKHDNRTTLITATRNS